MKREINEAFDFDSYTEENEFESGIEKQISLHKDFSYLNLIADDLLRYFYSKTENNIESFNYAISTITGGRFRLNCSMREDSENEMIIRAADNNIWKTSYKEMLILPNVRYDNVHIVPLKTIWNDFILEMKNSDNFKKEFLDSMKYRIILL